MNVWCRFRISAPKWCFDRTNLQSTVRSEARNSAGQAAVLMLGLAAPNGERMKDPAKFQPGFELKAAPAVGSGVKLATHCAGRPSSWSCDLMVVPWRLKSSHLLLRVPAFSSKHYVVIPAGVGVYR